MTLELGLNENSVIADIGSGTGKLTRLFLENENLVFAVEPNTEMRQAAEKLFLNYPNFKSQNGTAEATGLKNQSVDFITVAQAFHWFDIEKAKSEFQRILKSSGQVLLIWNKRLNSKFGFIKSYNDFLKLYSIDLDMVSKRRTTNEEEMHSFFKDGKFKLKSFTHFQEFDFDGLLGRYLSASYAFQSSHPKYEEMISFLKSIFEKNEDNGKVKIWYETVGYYGQI